MNRLLRRLGLGGLFLSLGLAGEMVILMAGAVGVAQKKEGLPCIWGRKELCVRAESLSALCSRAPSSLAPPYVSLIKTRSRHHTRKGCLFPERRCRLLDVAKSLPPPSLRQL
jgi:hypothetical protein